jgi:hypothetical protein
MFLAAELDAVETCLLRCLPLTGAARVSTFCTERAAEVGVASGQVPQFGVAVPPGLGMGFAA